ncbi:MAG: hypothetical protein K6T66_02845 [Peptococcaceae bacterium]|nr:hypothetical protein [Peptococcaceae bacterium]
MQGADFYSVFEQYKEKFLRQPQSHENRAALDDFEKWLRSSVNLPQVRIIGEKSKKIDLGKFLSNVTQEAKKILAGRGIAINVVSLGLKTSSRCIGVFKDSSIYYRLGKTSPRKGRYRGTELLIMELVMDGNKNNVFIPLLGRVEDLEKRMGTKIERESDKVEATGKYRFRLLFPFENDDSPKTVEKYATILSNFIYCTREELFNINVT